MILYNITFNIDAGSASEWLLWMKTEYIPAALAGGYFTQWKMYRLLSEQATDDPTFALQFQSDNLEQIERFLANEAAQLSAMINEKFRNRHVAFMTLLEEVAI
jgi:hypothetical protein